MDRDELKGFRRWLDDDQTPSRDIKAKRDAMMGEIEALRDPDLRRATLYLIRLIDEELQARMDLERLRKSYKPFRT